MALSLSLAGCAERMEPVLPRLAEQLREAIAAPRTRKGVSCPEALQVLILCCPVLSVTCMPIWVLWMHTWLRVAVPVTLHCLSEGHAYGLRR